MFMDFRDQPPPPRWEPRPLPQGQPATKLTERQAKALGWIVLLNVLLLIIAPIGGASIISALATLLQ